MTMKIDPNIRPDASLGLVWRLNILWRQADEPALVGDFDKWNAILDRIFCNLLYKEGLDVSYNEDGSIGNVQLSEKDQQLYDFLNKKYLEAKEKYKRAATRQLVFKAKEEMYSSLMMKDVGLRKFMFQLKLYMKDADKNPARAMWGG